ADHHQPQPLGAGGAGHLRGPYAQCAHDRPPVAGTGVRSASSGAIRTAHVLNSGMREWGSRAGLVRTFARPSPGQWNGMKTVSWRIAVVRRARATADPRALVTRTGAPS